MVIATTRIGTCGSMELAPSLFSPHVHRVRDCVYLKSLSSRPPRWFGYSKIGKFNHSACSLRMISNDYVGRNTYRIKKDIDDKIYRRLDSCLVIPPPKGKKPKAIIKFLGGAFIGAVPEVTYSYLLGLLANEGYLIISVPYNVTFDHSQATREVFERFHSCLNSILTSGLPDDGLLASG